MAQLNITLNHEDILLLLKNDRNEAFRQLLQDSLNSILKVESEEQLHAAPYERSDERTDSRNGTRERSLITRIGKIELEVPRHRNQPFKTMIFDNYKRSEAALIASMAEMVVNGVSTRKVSKVMEELCGTSYSKSTVSELCRELDAKVEEFRNRPLTKDYPFLTIDATYFKVRENHRIISRAFMIAYGTDDRGRREILGCGVYTGETKENWNDFLKGLKVRGLKGLLMITSDAHEGIRDAISRVFPNVPWQRCQFHFSKNIADKAPKKYQAGIRAELQEMFNCKNIVEARRKRDSILADYRDVAESAMTCLEEGFESSMTVMELPEHLRQYFRTSNHIERINRELKRRSKVIGVFPNEASLLRLMGAVLMELSDEAQERKALYSKKTYNRILMSETPAKLVTIAAEQRQLNAA
ncbi:MAG: IS256 family transposase [Erysipelotrichaceae bacterium]|nr:IS256 family transposase [Erysipelotrichaceae bacterium]